MHVIVRSTNFRYHVIVSHLILAICSIPMLIALLVCKNSFNKNLYMP